LSGKTIPVQPLGGKENEENCQNLIQPHEFICRHPVRVIEFFVNPIRFNTEMHSSARFTAMLAEKFFLVLETLRSHASDDKPQIVISTTQHIPITLPRRKQVGR
jgi:hypothetical protein